MSDKPWIERIFGPSWRSAVVGLGGMPIIIFCLWLGVIYKSAELLGIAGTLTAVVIGALSVLVRDNEASVAAHAESLRRIAEGQDAHAENVQKLQALEAVVGKEPIPPL